MLLTSTGQILYGHYYLRLMDRLSKDCLVVNSINAYTRLIAVAAEAALYSIDGHAHGNRIEGQRGWLANPK